MDSNDSGRLINQLNKINSSLQWLGIVGVLIAISQVSSCVHQTLRESDSEYKHIYIENPSLNVRVDNPASLYQKDYNVFIKNAYEFKKDCLSN